MKFVLSKRHSVLTPFLTPFCTSNGIVVELLAWNHHSPYKQNGVHCLYAETNNLRVRVLMALAYRYHREENVGHL